MNRRILFALLVAAMATVLVFAFGWGDATPETTTEPDHLGTAARTEHETGELQSPVPGQAEDAAARRVVPDQRPTWSLTGRVLGSEGVPLTGARILVYEGRPYDREGGFKALMSSFSRIDPDHPPKGIGLMVTGEPMASTEVKTDGTFRFDRLTERHLRLVLDHDYYGFSEPSPYHLAPSPGLEDAGDLDTYLGAHVRGQLIGAGNRQCWVRMLAEPDPMAIMKDPDSFIGIMLQAGNREEKTDVDGHFEFRAAWPTPDNKLLVADDHFTALSSSFSLSPGSLHEIALVVQPALGVVVSVQGEDSEPVARSSVRVRPADVSGDMDRQHRTRKARTSKDGMATIKGLQPGPHVVQVSAKGRSSVRLDIEVVPDMDPIVVVLGSGAAIEGRVFDSSGAPLVDAKVATMPAIVVPVIGDVSTALGTELLGLMAREDGFVTDADGSFRVTGLAEEGKFTVIAAAVGFVPSYESGVASGTRDVELHLEQAGRLTGIVVAAESGEPLREFSVEVLETFMLFMERPSRAIDISDAADGSFAMEGMKPGRVKLKISAFGRGTIERKFKVEAGTTTDIGKIEMHPPTIVRGRVVGPDGAPVPGATVSKRRTGLMENPIMASFFGGVAAPTNAAGEFELVGVAGGRFILSAHADGHATGLSERLRVESGGVLENVLIELGRGGSIQGSILLPPGEDFSLWQVVPNKLPSGSVTMAQVGADGTFRFDHLDPGNYDVQAMRMDLFQAMGDEIKNDWMPGRSFDFSRMFEKINEGVLHARCRVRVGEVEEIVLDGRDLRGPSTTLTLRVTLGSEPLEAGSVELQHEESGKAFFGFLQAGETRLAGVPDGLLRVQVRGGITMAPVGDLQMLDKGEGTTVLHIDLPGGRIDGRVLDFEDGQPLDRALVKIQNEEQPAQDTSRDFGYAMTDEEGRFTFQGLAPGTYTVLADESFGGGGDGRRSGRVSGVRVAGAGAVEDLVLHARPGAGLSVLVTDTGGEPVAGAMVVPVDDKGMPVGTLSISFTDSRGKAHLSGLPAGQVRLVARGGGLAPGISDLVQVTPGHLTQAAIALGTGTDVTLQVVDKDGQPLAGAQLAARTGGGPWLPSSLLVQGRKGKGIFHLGPLPPSEWEILVIHPSTGTFTVRRTISGGRSANLVIHP